MVLALAQHLHIGVQRLDRVLALRQLPVQSIAVPLGVHRVQALHPPRLVFNANLNFLQGDLRLFDLAVDLLRQSLQSVSTVGVKTRRRVKCEVEAKTTILCYQNFLRVSSHWAETPRRLSVLQCS